MIIHKGGKVTGEQIRAVIRRLDRKAALYGEHARELRDTEYGTQHAGADGRRRAYQDAAEYLRAYVPTPHPYKGGA